FVMPFSCKCCRQAIAIWDCAAKSLGTDLGNMGNSDMKRLTILAAAAITVGAAAPAAAADLPARAPAAYSKAPAIVEAAYDWSGFYAGINGGGATSNVDWNSDGGGGFASGDEGSHKPSGGTGGGQIGY